MHYRITAHNRCCTIPRIRTSLPEPGVDLARSLSVQERREAKAAGSGPRSFTTSKAGDVPYSTTRLAFELKTASAAPAATKGKGFLPATVRPRLSRMLTGLLLASRLASPPPHARQGNILFPERTSCPAIAPR